MAQAQYLFKDGASFALSIYVGGVAVECLLRAFKARRNSTFDEKHHLLRLFAASGMLRVDRDKLRLQGWDDERIEDHLRTLRVAVNEIFRIWSNTCRFVSEERLRSHLKGITGYKRIKVDYLREVARRFLDSCQRFIDKGVMLWRV